MQQKTFIHLIKSSKSILTLRIVQLKRKILRNDVIFNRRKTMIKKSMWDNYQFHINRKPSLKIDTQLAWYAIRNGNNCLVCVVWNANAYKYQSI